MKPTAALLAILAALYLIVSSAAWQLRNPTANAMTYWTHLGDALTFRKLPAFQVKP